MTLEELKASGYIIFESISGSRAYGLATASSDTDIRGVFILPKEHFYGLEYVGQINNESNDVVYYELRKFVELLVKSNPNILELLNMPEDCILHKDPLFDKFRSSDFLTKLCKNTFANYAFTQIKKARGLNKKIVNPVDKVRKNVMHFCVVRDEKQSMQLQDFLSKYNLKEAYCGLAKIPNMKGCFNLFYSAEHAFKGVALPKSNEVCLSSIPKELEPIGVLYFNKDGYSSYCKKHKEYWDWVANRNEARYENNKAHGKNYDTKNMMHTFRLLHMAKEISNGSLLVRRPDRDYLLDIKNGKFEYDTLVEKAEALHGELEELYEKSTLSELIDDEKMNELLIDIREEFYSRL